MLRPRSEYITRKFRLSQNEWRTLGAYATALGLTIEGGRYRGLPDHTAALRDIIREAASALVRETAMDLITKGDPRRADGQGSSTRG